MKYQYLFSSNDKSKNQTITEGDICPVIYLDVGTTMLYRDFFQDIVITIFV